MRRGKRTCRLVSRHPPSSVVRCATAWYWVESRYSATITLFFSPRVVVVAEVATTPATKRKEVVVISCVCAFFFVFDFLIKCFFSFFFCYYSLFDIYWLLLLKVRVVWSFFFSCVYLIEWKLCDFTALQSPTRGSNRGKLPYRDRIWYCCWLLPPTVTEERRSVEKGQEIVCERDFDCVAGARD